ncbi:MAG: type II CAAX endopeptidase family protein [Candidatus Omnitrophota bacterium]
MLAQIRRFLNEDQKYAWMLIFVILFFAVAQNAENTKAKPDESAHIEILKKLDQASLENILKQRNTLRVLFGLTMLAAFLAFVTGISLFFIFTYLFITKRMTFLPKGPFAISAWDIWDVARVCIIFLFAGQILSIIELLMSPVLKIIKDSNFRAIFNTSIMDTVVVVVILYFVILKYRRKLSALGVSFAKSFRNIISGIGGYLSLLPVLAAALVLVNFLSNVFKYTPKPERVIALFLKEQRPLVLFYLVLLVAVIGPVAEEIFFRGFLYPALRNKIGRPSAVAASGILFSLLHTNLSGLLPISILGMLLAYLYERTGSLMAPVAVHILHNSALVILIFFMRAVT